ncbi:hypothetical protein CWI38_0958p0030, partial [Hamiltosporidium tvaerminnensis]
LHPVNNSTIEQDPVNNSTNTLHPLNKSTNEQDPVNNSTNTLHPVNDSRNNLHPVSNSSNKQDPVSNTTYEQDPVNNSTIPYTLTNTLSTNTISTTNNTSLKDYNLHFKDDLVDKALNFIQSELAPIVESNSGLVSNLEDLMEYFVFGEGDSIEMRRRRVGGYVNGVLMSIYDGNSSELKEVLKGIVVGESKLSRKYNGSNVLGVRVIVFMHILGLGLGLG